MYKTLLIPFLVIQYWDSLKQPNLILSHFPRWPFDDMTIRLPEEILIKYLQFLMGGTPCRARPLNPPGPPA